MDASVWLLVLSTGANEDQCALKRVLNVRGAIYMNGVIYMNVRGAIYPLSDQDLNFVPA